MHVKKMFLTAFHSLTLQVRLVPLRHLSRTRSLYWSSAAEFVWEFGSTKFENQSTQKNHTTRGQKTRDTFLFQNGLFTIQHSDDELPKTGSALVIAQMLKFKLLEVLEPKGCSCLPLLGSFAADFWVQHSHFWTTTSFNFLLVSPIWKWSNNGAIQRQPLPLQCEMQITSKQFSFQLSIPPPQPTLITKWTTRQKQSGCCVTDDTINKSRGFFFRSVNCPF